ncbi:hypothetical protein [Oricola cellulosilytica]|uniref:Uncharacterized protein n=1 Tax=Oricola cellulosilytica TaxID=1429082 RepID=A0A4R0PDY4_9HYPH|nr:hypothetical protein [Oricola cellulosilytica]TCD14549.1 hypothetical protein E0D97_10875 [Oricola cellulosilytica]
MAGAFVWGSMMAVSAYVALRFGLGRSGGPSIGVILAIYFLGGACGFALAYPFLWFAHRISRPLLRTLLVILLLGIFTLGATALILLLQYRTYYAQWHGPALSRIWFWQQFYTALGSTYQYAVIGTRLYWPLGALFLLATSWWLSRQRR